VSTTARAGVPHAPNSIPALPVFLRLHSLDLLLATFLAVILLGLITSGLQRPSWLALTAATALAVMFASCGGGGSASSGPPPAVATSSGTYTVTVTATSGTLAQSLHLTLTVQ
jgi:hypothetical protein